MTRNYILISVFSAWFLAMSFSADSCEMSEHKWGSCEEHNDCVLVKGACTTPVAANKNFSKEEEKRQTCLSAVVECAKPPMGYDQIEYMARCEKQKCIVRQK